MALINTSIYSKVLQQRVPLSLFLPSDCSSGRVRKAKSVIYFLPGMGQDNEDFMNFTAANRYALDNTAAMVYVYAPHSFYQDMPGGFKYCTYITEELPKLLQSMFVLPSERENTFVAGLSMGGYGALKLGLSRPDLYSACASFSGSLDMGGMLEYCKNTGEHTDLFVQAFGANLEMEQTSDLFYLAQQMALKQDQTRIFVCCGKQDFDYQIYPQNQKFNEFAQTLNLKDYKYMEWDGRHDHAFWDRAMMHAMAFFMKNKYDKFKIKHWRD